MLGSQPSGGGRKERPPETKRDETISGDTAKCRETFPVTKIQKTALPVSHAIQKEGQASANGISPTRAKCRGANS